MGICTCCPFHALKASRIAQLARTNNEEVPRRYIYIPNLSFPNNILGKDRKGIFTYPWDIYRCFVFGKLKNFARILRASNPKRQVNAFSICAPPLLPPRQEDIQREGGTKVRFNCELATMNSQLFHRICWRIQNEVSKCSHTFNLHFIGANKNRFDT